MVNQIAFNLVFNKIVPTHQIEKIESESELDNSFV